MQRSGLPRLRIETSMLWGARRGRLARGTYPVPVKPPCAEDSCHEPVGAVLSISIAARQSCVCQICDAADATSAKKTSLRAVPEGRGAAIAGGNMAMGCCLPAKSRSTVWIEGEGGIGASKRGRWGSFSVKQ